MNQHHQHGPHCCGIEGEQVPQPHAASWWKWWPVIALVVIIGLVFVLPGKSWGSEPTVEIGTTEYVAPTNSAVAGTYTGFGWTVVLGTESSCIISVGGRQFPVDGASTLYATDGTRTITGCYMDVGGNGIIYALNGSGQQGMMSMSSLKRVGTLVDSLSPLNP